MNYKDQDVNYRWFFFFSLICLMCTSNLLAADYFVSPQGSDDNPGTEQRPFATFGKAVSLLKPGDTCYLRKGVYRQVLVPKQSGEPGAEITFSNWKNEKAVISGSDVLTGWKEDVYP